MRTCEVQSFRKPHKSDVILASQAVVAFMRYNATHRECRVKQSV